MPTAQVALPADINLERIKRFTGSQQFWTPKLRNPLGKARQ
jgi:hypothetical protein